jgi:serine/threonine protein kinase
VLIFLFSAGRVSLVCLRLHQQRGNCLLFQAQIFSSGSSHSPRDALAWQVASGLSYLHRHGILHGDLKVQQRLDCGRGAPCLPDSLGPDVDFE